MAKKVTSISSGLYYRETDLTFIQNAVGTFAGGSIGLMEKGPAFEVMQSSSPSERTLRLGGVNPLYKTSYYANEFLKQASNYKEVRMLGLEGYNEASNPSGTEKMFVVAYAKPNTNQPASTPINIVNIDGSFKIILTGDYSATSTIFKIEDNQILKISGVAGIPDINGYQKVDTAVYDNGENTTTVTLNATIVAGLTGTYVGGGFISTGTPFNVTTESVACILKPRREGYAPTNIEYVTISEVEGVVGANDDEFKVTIVYEGDQTLYAPTEVVCSLRPDSSQYITTVFGTNPLDNTRVLGNPSPLWVEVVFPSKTSKLYAKDEAKYYYPGTNSSDNKLGLLEGNITVDLDFDYQPANITDITIGATVTITTDYDPGLSIGDTVKITGLTSSDPALNGTWLVSDTPGVNQFTITDEEGNVPVVTGSLVASLEKFIRKSWTSTWETQIMNLGGTASPIDFQTPTTPWFVDKFDANGIAKRLFRLWSISDGTSANTEIKVEVSNIDPTGNGGSGSFDLYVRNFNDTEDVDRIVYEGFPSLTMDPKSKNYILRRIGDGENFPIKSKFIFVELNENESLPKTAIPYGVEGYVNVTNTALPDVYWTTQYDLSKSVTKQILGLANNRINMFKAVTPGNLIFKNTTGSITKGLGFHLNPGYIVDNLNSEEQELHPINPEFVLVNPKAYNKSDLDPTKLVGLNLSRRMKYTVAFEGGFDGWNVYSERSWDDETSKDYEALTRAIEAFADPEDLTADFSVLVTPDLNFESHPTASAAVLEMVQARGDALYLFDFNYRYNEGKKPEIIADTVATTLSSSSMLSSHAACYYPDVQIKDETNDINVWCPPSIVALATIAKTASLENVWQPPAGSLRTVTDAIVRVRKRMDHTHREVLKKVNINPITLFPGSGFEITESRTTQEAFSALSFIHNRLLLGYAKKTLNQVLRPLLHQLKSENLKSEFKNTITPIFERIKKLNGLEEFSVSVNGSDEDRTTLNGVIEIVPLYPVERIIVDFVLKDGGLDFNQ